MILKYFRLALKKFFCKLFLSNLSEYQMLAALAGLEIVSR